MAMFVTELLAIVTGIAAATGIVVSDCRLERREHREDAGVAVGAPSACGGATGTLPTLRAWIDGAELTGEPEGPAPKVDDALRARGRQVFGVYCAACHDERGSGNGALAIQLEDPPANFTTGVYQVRTTEHEALPTDRDLFVTITRGVHGTAMPPWFALPERDRWALVAHLKTLSKAFEEDEAPPPIVVDVPPAIAQDRIAHGASIYASGGCASCHGTTGRGDGPAATSLFYPSGLPARPRDLREGRFHRSTRIEDIYLTLMTGLDGTPMASFAKVLSSDDLWDVASYVHSVTEPFVKLPSGVRCPRAPLSSAPDEVIGVRTLLHSLHPTD